MPRSHYILWGNACEILSNVIFQSLSLDIKPKSGFRRAVTRKFNHFHCFSRSTEPEEIIRRHHRNLPGRGVQIVSEICTLSYIQFYNGSQYWSSRFLFDILVVASCKLHSLPFSQKGFNINSLTPQFLGSNPQRSALPTLQRNRRRNRTRKARKMPNQTSLLDKSHHHQSLYKYWTRR